MIIASEPTDKSNDRDGLYQLFEKKYPKHEKLPIISDFLIATYDVFTELSPDRADEMINSVMIAIDNEGLSSGDMGEYLTVHIARKMTLHMSKDNLGFRLIYGPSLREGQYVLSAERESADDTFKPAEITDAARKLNVLQDVQTHFPVQMIPVWTSDRGNMLRFDNAANINSVNNLIPFIRIPVADIPEVRSIEKIIDTAFATQIENTEI